MLSKEVILKVAAKAKELALHSWEYGTTAEALLELENPALSVFSKHPFPEDKVPSARIEDVESLQYAKNHIIAGSSRTLCKDNNSVADPASLGVFAILIGQSHPECLDAAHRQMEYLYEAPSYGNSKAISHRKDVEEVWADFIYMVPPFLAYYALAVDKSYYMKQAVEQCVAYNEILATKSEGLDRGLWHHIAGPKNVDPGYWCTSNGWVAAGLAQILATLMSWSPTREWHHEAGVLRSMIRYLIDGVIATDEHRDEAKLLPNYLYAKDKEPWFGDVAGTALLSSVVYHMMVLDSEHFHGLCHRGGVFYTAWADNKSRAVSECVDEASGIAKPAVNPLKHSQRQPLMTGSPEAQSFVVLMWAAMRDYMAQG
ncbi:hypothetical protein N0V90_008514 [Kalmusia sp. IMI 367209]|nr:hypothetical protein N0V90_008514 [Kalmusia sp. IMI 367209]